MRHAMSIMMVISCTPAIFAAPAVTFHKDIEPLLQSRCQSCHRPGEIGPMPLMNYQQVRPWAAAIKEAVLSKKMPPWFADGRAHQQYNDDPSLTGAELATIENWVASGAPEGNLKDAPAPRQFVGGWNIGTPDVVVEMPQAYAVPASGTVEYTYIIIPSGFTKDTWVTAAEIRPGTPASMHHAILFTRTPGSKWLRSYPAGVPFVPAPRPGQKVRSSDGDRTVEGSLADEWLVGYAPGQRPWPLPKDTAYLVKAGSDFVLQLHYTPSGKTSSDRTRIGLVLSKERPAHRALVAGVANGTFAIPPGDSNHQVEGSSTFASNVKVLAASPHMHLRGKAMLLESVDAEGARQGVFDVPRYDFKWQQMYSLSKPLTMTKGSKLEMKAWFDNSRNNPNNPDPTATVHWGDQTYEEMALAVLIIQIDTDQDLEAIFERPQPAPVSVRAAKE